MIYRVIEKTNKNQIMKLASTSYSVMALMVVSVLFEVNVANPLPKSEDYYGDFDASKLDRKGKEIRETFCFTYMYLGSFSLAQCSLTYLYEEVCK